MKYLALLYQDPSTFPTDAAGRERLNSAYEAFTKNVRAAQTFIDGSPLSAMPNEVRTITGGVVKDGPPSPRSQALVGFYILDYPALDAAVAAAHAIPAAASGSVEVVPFLEM